KMQSAGGPGEHAQWIHARSLYRRRRTLHFGDSPPTLLSNHRRTSATYTSSRKHLRPHGDGTRGDVAMSTYFMRRALTLFPTLLGAITVVFLVIHLIPGDPVAMIMRDYYTTESATALRHLLGL